MIKDTENTIGIKLANKTEQQLMIKMEQLDKQKLKQDDDAFELKQQNEQLARNQKDLVQSKQLLKKEKNWLQEQQEKLNKSNLDNQQQLHHKEEQLSLLQQQLEVRALEVENGLPELAKQHVAEQLLLIDKQKAALKDEQNQLSVHGKNN